MVDRSRSDVGEPADAATAALEAALVELDAAVAQRAGLELWIGGEPTFTDRSSSEAAWVSQPLGADKERRARGLVAALQRARGGPGRGVLLRCVGRQYPDEPHPRWSYGLLERRDGASAWTGPCDPLALGEAQLPAGQVRSWAAALQRELVAAWVAAGHDAVAITGEGVLPYRAVFTRRAGGALPAHDLARDEDVQRAPLHAVPTPDAGLREGAWARGFGVLAVGADAEGVRAELPWSPDAAHWLPVLEQLGHAARRVGIPDGALIVGGYPPPPDPRLAFTTVTPDPAVVEVNMAPATSGLEFFRWQRAIHRAAADVGLSPERLYWNGDVADSGGGGHLTLGGPSASDSPFLRAPHLLPGLIARVHRHPSLSYLHAIDALGASSQAPRVDEGIPEMFGELQLALASLARQPARDLDELWAALAPFLTDASGNPHRAEINVEKLANPRLPGRGRLGVVELRAFRMAPDAVSATALACLLRSLCALVIARPEPPWLTSWGEALHDVWALPTRLRADMAALLRELDDAGVGLPPVLARACLAAPHRDVASVPLPELAATLELARAAEFWPLVGDTSSQERHGARWIDSSTHRLELGLHGGDAAGLVLAVRGYELPLAPLVDPRHAAAGERLAVGVRYRAFVPRPGLHPGLLPDVPLVLHVWPRDPGHAALDGRALAITIHDWRPDGEAYAALPADGEDARARRQARVTVEIVPRPPVRPPTELPPGSRMPHTVDLRWL
jgi:uncharacterized protein (DUF2126 family)